MIHCIGDSHAAVFSGKDEMVPAWPEQSNDTLELLSNLLNTSTLQIRSIRSF